MTSVKNKIVIITGGNRGIGKQAVRLFAQEHAKVVVFARNRHNLEKLDKLRDFDLH